MTKLLILGIDGMDSELVSDYIDYLPNLKKIKNENPTITSTSVFPPDSDTAWASIYTGLNPAKHGVVDFVDPLERKKIIQKESEYFDVNVIKGQTFWDIAGGFKKKVCIINPHIAFPVWKVNGFMCNPHPRTGEFHMYPPDFKFNFEPKQLRMLKRIPRSKLEFKQYLKKKTEAAINEFNFGSKMLVKHDWDLLFIYSSILDSIQHIFWNYCDTNDPTYPGNNLFKDSVKDFYILFDKLIGEMLNQIDSKTNVLILSDHGHSMRPVNLLNINEILRQEGLLHTAKSSSSSVMFLKEKLKRGLVDIAQKSGFRPAAQTFLRIFPSIKKMYSKPGTIDFDKTIAHCTDMSGLKSYTYGGIVVRRNKFSCERDYEKTKSDIMEILASIKIPNSSQRVVKWIYEREKLYSGQHITKYPEIIFQLKEGYGSGWDINLPIFTKSVSHKFYPGSHRGSTPIFYFLNNTPQKIKKDEISLMDIAPTILDLLDIDWTKFHFDGKSILESESE